MFNPHPGDVLAVVGGQYGSEGKGVIVAAMANLYDWHVRVGGPNAGHSFSHEGKVYKMQVIPCGWINPEARIVLGRGILIDLKQLKEELKWIHEVDPNFMSRLYIDECAGVLSKWHGDEEGGVQGEMHKRIGSTGKGVGPARRDRLMRDPEKFKRMKDIRETLKTITFGGVSLDSVLHPATESLLVGAKKRGSTVLLEGTQGAGLSLIHGPWPYVTSADTNAAQMAADIGLPAHYVNRCLVVLRTLPIRVAGNSGPLANEISWGEVSRRTGEQVEEKTTVTHKIRRVGEWDEDLAVKAKIWNAPTSVAVTFMDYLEPADKGIEVWDHLSGKSRQFIAYIEALMDSPVICVGTGGDGWKIAQSPSFVRP